MHAFFIVWTPYFYGTKFVINTSRHATAQNEKHARAQSNHPNPIE
jgi:hypothetical protein